MKTMNLYSIPERIILIAKIRIRIKEYIRLIVFRVRGRVRRMWADY